MCAAPSDFAPITIDGKIRSGKNLNMALRPLPRALKIVHSQCADSLLVAFKSEYNKTDDELKTIMKEKIRYYNAQIIVANDVSRTGAGYGVDTNDVLILSKDGKFWKMKAEKVKIAENLLDICKDMVTNPK
jgi:phosphopantothenoylcysteine decarboxylase/phosphopantothenate--cysteine ligase